MNINLKQKTTLLVVFVGLLVGCGQGNSPITADKENVDKAKVMRELYTKANGNYDLLSADEKTQFQKAIAPGLPVEKAWNNLAPQKANMGGGGDPRQGG